MIITKVKYYLLLLSLMIAYGSQSQIIDTLYYQHNWSLSTPEYYEYYLIAHLDTASNKFNGEIKGYNKNKILIAQGKYGQDGDKEGQFLRYYNNGNRHSVSGFSRNEMVGKWNYFNENGDKFQKIEFESNEFNEL